METNFEHYKDDITEIVEETKNISLRLNRLEKRTNFMRNDDASLANMFIEWSVREYVEIIKITSFEKIILDKLKKKYERFAIDVNNDGQRLVYFFRMIPPKNYGEGFNWCLRDGEYFLLTDYFRDCEFINLETNKMYWVSDILENCEVID